MAKPRQAKASSPASSTGTVPNTPSTEPAAEWVAIDDLRPWKDNPRRNDKVVAKVVESIKRFGFGAPILARRETAEIIAGHTRWKAARRLKLDRVPVRFLDLDPTNARLLALADNRIGEDAEWDDEKLAALLSELKAQGAEIAASAFDEAEIGRLLASVEAVAGALAPTDAPEAKEERADELRAKWSTERGQLWEARSKATPGKVHRLFCGDSTLDADVARLMGEERADMMWTDPPYGVSYKGGGRPREEIANDKLAGGELFEFLAAAFVAADRAALMEGAALYVAYPAGRLATPFHLAFEHTGWSIHQGLVWVKDRIVFGMSDFHYRHEPLLFGYKPANHRRGRYSRAGWYGDDKQSTVFEVPAPRRSEAHPTMKPVELVVPMVRNSAPLGGVVYEPFSGSGTTLIACESSGRLGRAIEIEPKYVAVALERLAEMGLEVAKAA